MKKGGLGRGLSSLIPGPAEQTATAGGPLEVPIEQVRPNPRQPRSRFDGEPLDSLALSIQEVGILQPLVVRRVAGGFELIAGERRLRAARKLGLATVPVVLRESDDAESLREALIENIHREDLNPIELAESFRELLDELGVKQEVLASRLGVSRSHIANTLRLLQLPTEVQSYLVEGRLQAGHGRALLALGDAAAQRSLALRAVAEGLSVRDVESSVRSIVDRPATPGKSAVKRSTKTAASPFGEIEEILSEQLQTRVAVQGTRDRGRIVVEFGSSDDLDRIVGEIVGDLG